MTTDASFCQQRLLTQLYNIPPNRITITNPYTSGRFTKMQLDMRRKVEILKYSANKSSTQTNNLTKKEQFALLVRGGLSRTTAVIQSNAVSCNIDDEIPTPTSSCDVPGPVTYLTYDKTVPLYNYSNFNTRPYSDIAQSNGEPWQFVVLSNVLIYDNQQSIIDYLIINNTISKQSFNYTASIPFSITATGNIPPNSSGFNGNLTIALDDATLEIYFNPNNLVKSVSLNDIVGQSVTIHIPSNATSTAKTFRVTQFIGNLLFQNILLYTTSSYVYTFMLKAKLSVSPVNSGVVTGIAVVANTSSSIPTNEAIECSIVSTHTATNLGASIQGV
jgi:hypothetical protein